MAVFKEFIEALLDNLNVRGQSAVSAVFDSRRRYAGVGEILIGIGEAQPNQGGEAAGVCLNGKTANPQRQSDTAYVMAASAEQLETWRRSLPAADKPEMLLSQVTLVVEDCSPDSIMALLCLLVRLYDVEQTDV